MIKIIKTNKRCYLNKKDFVDIEDILRDLKADYESFNLPETFEELKELCDNLEQKVNNLIVKFLPPEKHYDCEVIWFKQYGLWVYSNGFILFKKDMEEDMIGGAKNRTPAQMWQIIKNLIGE